MTNAALNILRVDASGRQNGSTSRALTDHLTSELKQAGAEIAIRDLINAPAPVDETWIGANFTPADQRTPDQISALATSDALVAELQAADVVVIGSPIYNFGLPAALKAWIDMVARAGVTFRYTPNGPQGLLEGKKAVVIMASGGTPVNSPIDFATPHLKHVLSFIGITDVEIVAADGLMGGDAEAKLAAGRAQLSKIAANLSRSSDSNATSNAALV